MYDAYREGSIISLHLRNFQTYLNADFNFHPQLNFIAGPNGSGKSSIANAIAFIFCGTPNTIGKTKDIAEYVNFSAGEASVEACIKYKEGTCNLKRVFNKINKKSIWYINNVHKKQTEYVLFIEKLNINVDNLCQFLPQEKVSEFSSLSPEELLVHALDSQGDRTIIKMKDELKVLEEEENGLQVSIEDLKRKKEGIERIIQNLSKDVEKLKERGQKEVKIRLMKLKRKWLMYELLKKEFNKIKGDISAFRKEILTKEQLMEDCEKKITELKNSKEIKKLEEEKLKIKQLNTELEEVLIDIKQQYKQIDMLEVDKKSVAKKRETRAHEIESQEKNLEMYMKRHETLKIEEPEPCKVDSKEIDKLEEALFDMKMQKSKIADDSQSIQARMEELQKKHHEICKEEYRRLEFLKKYHCDTYDGVMWLRENKKLFKDEIIEPPVLSIKLKMPKFIHEVETFLNFQLLSSFICKNSDDFELLLRVLKDEKKLAINAIEKIDEKRKNILGDEELRKIGFEGMLIDMIDAREEIRDFFNSVAHFYAIPITKANVNESEIFDKYEIKRMATRNKFVEIKRSQYNRNDFVISESGLNSIGLFSQFSQDQNNQIENAMRELNSRRSSNQEKYKEIMQKMEDIENKLNKLYKVRNDYVEKMNETQRQKAQKEQLELAIKRSKDQIIALKDFSCLDEEEKIVEERIGEESEKAVMKIKKLESMLRDKGFYERVKILRRFEKEIFEQNSTIEKEMAMKTVYEDERSVLYASLMKLEKEKSIKKNEMDSCKETLKENPLKDEEKLEFSTFPNTIEDLETAIALESAKLPFYNCDPELEKDFSSKEEELNKIHLKLSSLDTKSEILNEKIKSLRSECTAGIYKFVGLLNEQFSNFFKKLRCEGRILFVEEGLLSSKWKLNVLVKFREDASLEVLTSTKQSGGEKSVSTILFLLALQSISPAPFRLVDEINQGMDRYNEKLVHDILVSLSTPNFPQFFIITPKIVQGITFGENMKVHIIFAGNFNALQNAYNNYKYNATR